MCNGRETCPQRGENGGVEPEERKQGGENGGAEPEERKQGVKKEKSRDRSPVLKEYVDTEKHYIEVLEGMLEYYKV